MATSRQPGSLRARRIITLLHLFSAQQSLPLSTVAKALDTDEATAREEIELLSCCGVSGTDEQLVPVYIDDESGEEIVVFWGEPPALERTLRLSAAESRALVAALTAAGLDSDDPLVAKLEASLGSSASFEGIEQMLRSVTTMADPEPLKVLSLALEEHRTVEITYHTGGATTGRKREVEPLALMQERGDWYLDAYCRDAKGLRTFRLDRISAAKVTNTEFQPRTARAFTPLDHDKLPLARIRLAPGEEFSAREWPSARLIETEDDGSLVVGLPYAGTSWIARQVVARLGRAEVIEPAEVRAAVAGLARELIEQG